MAWQHLKGGIEGREGEGGAPLEESFHVQMRKMKRRNASAPITPNVASEEREDEDTVSSF